MGAARRNNDHGAPPPMNSSSRPMTNTLQISASEQTARTHIPSQRLRHAKSATLDNAKHHYHQQQQQNWPALRKSPSSSRFGKSLLPTWLGGNHNNNNNQNPNITIAPVVPIPSIPETMKADCGKSAEDLDKTFESLLDELEMKNEQRDKLRDLPPDHKLYLLQQKQHLSKSPSITSLFTNAPFNKQLASGKRSNNNTNNEAVRSLEPPAKTTINRGRAATYKFNKQLSSRNSRASKVGSMIMEFDAMAKHQQDGQDSSSSSWLLLETSTSTQNQHHRTNRVQQSLTRKEGSHLAALAAQTEEASATMRDRPYYYVERLRNR